MSTRLQYHSQTQRRDGRDLRMRGAPRDLPPNLVRNRRDLRLEPTTTTTTTRRRACVGIVTLLKNILFLSCRMYYPKACAVSWFCTCLKLKWILFRKNNGFFIQILSHPVSQWKIVNTLQGLWSGRVCWTQASRQVDEQSMVGQGDECRWLNLP